MRTRSTKRDSLVSKKAIILNDYTADAKLAIGNYLQTAGLDAYREID